MDIVNDLNSSSSDIILTRFLHSTEWEGHSVSVVIPLKSNDCSCFSNRVTSISSIQSRTSLTQISVTEWH